MRTVGRFGRTTRLGPLAARAGAAILLLWWLGANAAGAIQCGVGGRPGSTLLYPYFELDPTRPDGLTTLLSIGNDSPTATLTRFVFWTQWATPGYVFDLLLEPFEVRTI